MNKNNIDWMINSIILSNQTTQLGLKVGAVLVSSQNEIICSAYSGEESGAPWYTTLINKIRRQNIIQSHQLYLSINTLTEDNSFHLSRLINEIHINEIYIGLPDPMLDCYFENDPVSKLDCVYRYPDELQCKILELNSQYYACCPQSIKNSPFYAEMRISSLVLENLKDEGFPILYEELHANKQKFALASLVSSKYSIDFSKAVNIVHSAVSNAFDDKYSTYDYNNDVRSINTDWKKRFVAYYNSLSEIPIEKKHVLNIGVGSGIEASELFQNCTNITFIDIAPSGLNKVQEQIPHATTLISSADNLSELPDNSYDLYISLRTYNSSFFDVKEAIAEAYRILRSNALIIVSVANGFLNPDNNTIIPGLIIPGTELVDIYRSFDTIRLIKDNFIKVGFKNTKIFPTNTEIFLSAYKT